MRASIRWTGVLIAICSWIAVSNHCAFAAVATDIAKGETECPFHSKPPKQKDHSSQLQCCRVLRAVFFAQNKTWARDEARFGPANFPIPTGGLMAGPPHAAPPSFFDTGPPSALSFAELILQRSLFAHAPPSFV